MNGLIVRAAMTCVILAVAISPALNNAARLPAQMGCNACHMGDSSQPNKTIKKNRAHLHTQNSASTPSTN